MGFSPTFQPYDPLGVRDLTIDVRDDGDRLLVVLTSGDAASAAILTARAQALGSSR